MQSRRSSVPCNDNAQWLSCPKSLTIITGHHLNLSEDVLIEALKLLRWYPKLLMLTCAHRLHFILTDIHIIDFKLGYKTSKPRSLILCIPITRDLLRIRKV